MIRDSDMVLTVSRTSAKQLYSIYGVTGNDVKHEDEEKEQQQQQEQEEYNARLRRGKIRIVGTGVDKLSMIHPRKRILISFALDGLKS